MFDGNHNYIFQCSIAYLFAVINQAFLSNTNNLHIVVCFQIFVSNTNNFHTIIWFQVIIFI